MVRAHRYAWAANLLLRRRWLLVSILRYFLRAHLNKLFSRSPENTLTILEHIIITGWILPYKVLISLILIKGCLGHFQILILVRIIHLRLNRSALYFFMSLNWESMVISWHLILILILILVKVSVLTGWTLTAKLILWNSYGRNLLILRVTRSL